MGRVIGLAVVGVLLAIGGGCSEQPSPDGGVSSAASCVGPYLDAQGPGERFGAPAPTVAPGATITIYGHFFTTTCNDTNLTDDPLEPMPPVRLVATLPGGGVERLAAVTPDGPEAGFAVDVTIPVGTPTGTVTVSDDAALSTDYAFAVGR